MLYFLALIPPSPLKDEIHELKLQMKERFDSAHSLKAPPHITLLSPFRLEDETKEKVDSFLKNFTQDFNAIEVQLNNFSTFTPRVIFIGVEQNPDLMDIQLRLEKLARSNPELFNCNYEDRPYHPHLTLAFKDLTLENFNRARDEFKNKTFNASFNANTIYLLKHTGKKWEVDREYSLGG